MWKVPAAKTHAVDVAIANAERAVQIHGATGVARIDKGISAFVGGAVSTNGQHWVGKAGVRVGW